MFDYILFWSEMGKETRILFVMRHAPICMVCLFSETIRDFGKLSSQIDRENLIENDRLLRGLL